MAQYTRRELEEMQREAEKRVNDMQSRARKNLNWEAFGQPPGGAKMPAGGRNPATPHISQPPPGGEKENFGTQPSYDGAYFRRHGSDEHIRNEERPEKSGLEKLISGPLSFLEKLNVGELLKDSDTAFLIAILLLVGRDSSDPLLTVALIYIMF